MASSIQNKNQFCFLLLSHLEETPDDLKKICQSMGWSKQRLDYWMRKMALSGLIRKTQSYPFRIYEITDLGQQVKKSIGQYDNTKAMFRLHNKIVSWRIDDWGRNGWEQVKAKFGNPKEMRGGWQHVREKKPIKTDIGTFKVQITSGSKFKKPLMMIFCPRDFYTWNKAEGWGKIGEKAASIAQKYAEVWGWTLGRREETREGQTELIGSQKIANLFGKGKYGQVWVDASDGSNCLEENESSNYIEKMLVMPERLEKIEAALVPAIDRLTEQIILHLDVQKKTGEALDEIKGYFKRLNDGNSKE